MNKHSAGFACYVSFVNAAILREDGISNLQCVVVICLDFIHQNTFLESEICRRIRTKIALTWKLCSAKSA